MQNEEYIWDWLKLNTDLNEFAIAAIMGNIQAESAGEPMRRQGDFTADRHLSREFMQNVDSGNTSEFFSGKYGWGLCQWTYPARCKNLFAYAKSNGVSIGDIDIQLSFMMKELKNDYKTVYNSLMTAANVATPCARFLLEFERPANAQAQVSKRTEMAQAIFDRNHKEETPQADNKPDNTELTNRLLDIVARQNQITEDLKELVELCQMQ